MLTDAHAHLSLYEEAELRSVIQRAEDAHVRFVVTAGETWDRSVQEVAIAKNFQIVYANVGIHPWHAYQIHDDSIFSKFRALAQKPKVVGIGEVGLDFAWDHPLHKSPREIQEYVFRKQIQLAVSIHLPLVIHDKNAHARVLEVLREEGGGEVGGVIHDFHGDALIAERYLEMGFFLSENGSLTYPEYEKVRETIKNIPLERLLIETDCPFFTPRAKGNSKNEPAFVGDVADEIAELKGIPSETVAAAAESNLRRIFRLGG